MLVLAMYIYWQLALSVEYFFQAKHTLKYVGVNSILLLCALFDALKSFFASFLFFY